MIKKFIKRFMKILSTEILLVDNTYMLDEGFIDNERGVKAYEETHPYLGVFIDGGVKELSAVIMVQRITYKAFMIRQFRNNLIIRFYDAKTNTHLCRPDGALHVIIFDMMEDEHPSTAFTRFKNTYRFRPI